MHLHVGSSHYRSRGKPQWALLQGLEGLFPAATGPRTVASKAKASLNSLNATCGIPWVQAFAQQVATVESENQALRTALEEAGNLILGVKNGSIPIMGNHWDLRPSLN